MHKIDLIYRLQKSEPHNAAHYQRQLEQHLVQHDDMIHRLVDIMKTDDYFRQTEDLPMIDPFVAYDKGEQFSELFEAKEAVSIISTEVDILERQVCWPGMYPILQSPVPTTSGFVPHMPKFTFNPAAPSLDHLNKVHSTPCLTSWTLHRTAAHLQAAQYHVLRDHQLTNSKIYQLQHSKVHLLILSLPHKVNKYLISKMPLVSSSLHLDILTLNHRMLHHCNLLHQHPHHCSSLL